MAAQHFNARDARIVPELGQALYRDVCRVEIPLYCDYLSSVVPAVRSDNVVCRTRTALYDLAARAEEGGGELCGIVGPSWYKSVDAAAVMANAWQIPLVSYFPTDSEIGKNHRRPGTAAITASVDEQAEALLEYVLLHRQRNYVGLVYEKREYAYVREAFQEAWNRLKAQGHQIGGAALEVKFYPFEIKEAADVVQQIKADKWKTVIVALPRINMWDTLFEEAAAQDMISPAAGYVWHSFTTSDLEALTIPNADWTPKKPPTRKPKRGLRGATDEDDARVERARAARAQLLDGAGYFTALNGFEEDADAPCDGGQVDSARRFLCAWRGLTARDLDVVRAVHPFGDVWPADAGGTTTCLGDGGRGGRATGGSSAATGRYDPAPDYFQTELPPPFSALIYDAVVALGMAACRARHEEPGDDWGKLSRNPDPDALSLPKWPYTNQDSPIYNELVNKTFFTGASGHVVLHNNNWFTRPSETLTFGVYNIRAAETFNQSTTFETRLASVRRPGEGWTDVDDFYYAGNTLVEPPNYEPPVPDQFPAWAIVVTVCVPCICAVLLVAMFKRRVPDDSMWLIPKSELTFSSPPQCLGNGTFGRVLLAEYRGTQVATKQEHAQKTAQSPYKRGSTQETVVSHNSLGPERASKRRLRIADQQDFKEEMRQLTRMHHPCVTTLMGAVLEKNEKPIIVMEYMENGSLRDLLRNVSVVLEGDSVLPLIRDIAQGIRFLHSATPPVIHGDLKARNILVDSKLHAKVGLSAHHKQASGSYFWMAPELLARKGATKNARTDVYAFGMILYEIYARKEPYEDEVLEVEEVLKLVADPKVNKRPPLPKSCPPQILSMMSDCLEGDPFLRPTIEELDIRLKRLNVETAEPNHRLFSKQKRKSIHVNVIKSSQELLDDVFPAHIARALQEGRRVDPESREVVTIFFSDIVGFTNISSTLEPIKISNMLDRLYQKFDDLSHKHDVFKVETIGDAYMAVTNLVKDQASDHAERIAKFSIDALKAANETIVDVDDESKGYVNIRVGFHSGPVVANVVGSRNPRYCLFGDTVNTASRMESNSIKNRIHCSENAVNILKIQSPKIPITSRGLIQVKGKGEMHTYWVNE